MRRTPRGTPEAEYEMVESKSEAKLASREEKVSYAPSPTMVSILPKDLLASAKGRNSRRPMRADFRLVSGFQVVVNSSANKYLQFLSGTATSLAWNLLASANEFTSLDALFDEVFVKSVKLKFIPRNRHSAQSSAAASASGSPGDVNTVGASLHFLPHSVPAFADNSINWSQSQTVEQSKFVDLGSPFEFTAINHERFAWDGPEGDQTSAQATQGWLNFTRVSTNLGGNFYLSTPVASGAAAGIGVLLEGGIFGDLLVEWNIAVRARA